VQAVAAAVAKKKQTKKGAGWSWRLAGIALCAFFALGVITGLSRAGRQFAVRLEAVLHLWPELNRSAMVPIGDASGTDRDAPAPRKVLASVALVERTDGFYTLDAGGELRGPVSPAMQGDLPVLSGVGVQNAPPAELLEDAATLVRSEAALSTMISEMRADRDGIATLFLDHPRLPIVIALEDAALEVARSAQVLRLWRSHQDLIAVLDMTASGQAVIRLKPGALENARRASDVRKAAVTAPRIRSRHNPPPEMTARR
jgi:hypothetical protein